MPHVLVVGGTGMLRGTSLHLASQGNTVSVIARRSLGLNSLAQEASHLAGQVNPIQVDYRDGKTLRAKLEEAMDLFGAVTLAVCWIHSTAPQAPFIIGESLGRGPSVCRYFDVMGSALADPLCPQPQRKARLQKLGHILYRKIILGFIIENGISRWLTDAEISTGVIQAIERDEPSYIVGTVGP